MPPKPFQTGGDGGIGTDAGFFFAFIPFFLRAGAPRFVVLDFFAKFNLPIVSKKTMPIPHHTATTTIGLVRLQCKTSAYDPKQTLKGGHGASALG